MSLNLIICRTSLLMLLIAYSVNSNACVPPAFERVADEYGVPADVFYSIALAESGHSTRDFGFKVWPWALNIDKKSYFPESKQAALDLIEKAIIDGNVQFDVGLMQVSWRFHKSTFQSNAEYALDIGANLRAGAKIFSEFIHQADDVWQAVGFYNAGASRRVRSIRTAQLYSDRVKRIYNTHVKESCHGRALATS